MKKLFCGMIGWMALSALADAADAPPASRRAFTVQGEYREIASSRATITGHLPEGWEEDSAWADVEAHYRPQEINPFAGSRALRVEVKAVRNGAVQFRVPNIAADPARAIRIRAALRSEDNRTVSLILRQRGAPYRSYWSTVFAARPEWGEYEALAVVAAADPAAVLTFSMNAAGALEVGALSVEYVPFDAALGGRSFDGNLLPTSVFPLGLTAPWAVGANGSTPEHARPDPATPGPPGLPALRLVSHRYEGRPMMQITAPFVGKPGATHSLSLWARAEKPGMNLFLRLGPPAEALYKPPWQTQVTLSDEWRRYEFSVALPPAPDFVYLARITTHDEGAFWVDGLQVEVAEKAGPHRLAGPVETHAVAARDYGLSLDDEPMGYRVAVVGEPGRAARIEGTVLDLYGVERPLPPIELRADARFQTFEAALPPTDAYGSFLVTLRAVDAEGRAVGHSAELLLHRVRRPRHWDREAPDSPFGTHVAATETDLRMAKALGFNWNRVHYGFNWSEMENAEGAWNFEKADRTIALHQKQRMLILTHLGGVPRKYSVVGPNWEGANSWYRTAAAPRLDAMDAFETYARRLLERAGAVVRAVEVWNEPFLPGFFVGDIKDGRPVRERPEVLVEMNRRARAAAEAAGYRGLLFWNSGPHYGESERKFDEAVRDLGGGRYVDGVTFHRYGNASYGLAGDQFDRDLSVIRETFADRGLTRHIWNSEGGHGLSEVFNLYREIPPARGRDRARAQAAQYVRYFLANFAAGAEKVFIYTFHPMDRWNAEYGYLNVDGRLSQIAPATSNMAWQLEGKKFAERREISDAVCAHEYRGAEENTVVLLPTGRGAAVLRRLPPRVRAADVYGNPPRLPHNFDVLYLSAPGLTLEHVAAILKAETDEELPALPWPTADVERPPAPFERWTPGRIGILAAAAVLLLLLAFALRPKAPKGVASINMNI